MSEQTGFIARWRRRILDAWQYCSVGVWSDLSPRFGVKVIKTVNLSITSFFNAKIQQKAKALSFMTLLSAVPAFAMLFAIATGFNFQDIAKEELIKSFASQEIFINKAFAIADAYLRHTSDGLILGVGVVVLIWTLISLLGSVEEAFNGIWGVASGRSFWHKVTDYVAIFIILPVLLLLGSGVSMFVGTSINLLFPEVYVSSLQEVFLEIFSWATFSLFFALAYVLIPTTKVKIKNAIIPGMLAGTAFMVLQWLFVTGQVYVTKYNAIYGSLAFLPLFMLWIQLVWVICLSGCVLCYASQNIFRFNFNSEVLKTSQNYRMKVTLAVMQVIVNEYFHHKEAPTLEDFSNKYGLPSRLAANCADLLIRAGLVKCAIADAKRDIYSYIPAYDASTLTVGDVIRTLRYSGASDFVPGFDERFAQLIEALNRVESAMISAGESVLIKDLPIDKIPDN